MAGDGYTCESCSLLSPFLDGLGNGQQFDGEDRAVGFDDAGVLVEVSDEIEGIVLGELGLGTVVPSHGHVKGPIGLRQILGEEGPGIGNGFLVEDGIKLHDFPLGGVNVGR